jgi:hypothetical protein
MKKSSGFIGNRARDLPACSVMPQPTILRRAPAYFQCSSSFSPGTFWDSTINYTTAYYFNKLLNPLFTTIFSFDALAYILLFTMLLYKLQKRNNSF